MHGLSDILRIFGYAPWLTGCSRSASVLPLGSTADPFQNLGIGITLEQLTKSSTCCPLLASFTMASRNAEVKSVWRPTSLINHLDRK